VAATLTAPAVSTPGNGVTVSWAGLTTPRVNDFVTLVPPGAPPDEVRQFVQTGGGAAGSVVFPINPDYYGFGAWQWRLGDDAGLTIYAVANVTLAPLHAYTQARSGIARSGATRSNYYTGDAVVTIDNGGVATDISKHIVHNGWHISLNLNDDIDTASIALLPSCPFVPAPRSQIKIGYGSANNLFFAGIVLTVQRTRRPGPDPRFWYDLTCVDWTALLDARFVVGEFPAQSVTTTILDIVKRFSRGGIATDGVAQGLPSIPAFSVVQERPSTILRRITNKIGGGFYLDAHRVLRAWSSTIPSPIQEQTPIPLTDHLPTLKTFRVTDDGSQQRTIVFAEGARTELAIGVPAWPNDYVASVPVEDASAFMDPANTRKFARFGTQMVTYEKVLDVVPAGVAPLAAKAAIDTAAGAAVLFASSLPAGWPEYGWARVGNQAIAYATNGDGTSLGIQAYTPTYGTIRDPIAANDAIVALDSLLGIHGLDRDATTSGGSFLGGTGPWYGYVQSPLRAQLQGTPVVLVRGSIDDAAASTIATREQSDGYYEHLVQDGRWTAAGAAARAQAEIADFAQPTATYEWDTEDQNAEPGRMQHIALTEGTPVTADVRITNVEITPIATKHPPRRRVRATKIQTAGVVEIWLDDPR
jgi:hypothetical protein